MRPRRKPRMALFATLLLSFFPGCDLPDDLEAGSEDGETMTTADEIDVLDEEVDVINDLSQTTPGIGNGSEKDDAKVCRPSLLLTDRMSSDGSGSKSTVHTGSSAAVLRIDPTGDGDTPGEVVWVINSPVPHCYYR